MYFYTALQTWAIIVLIGMIVVPLAFKMYRKESRRYSLRQSQATRKEHVDTSELFDWEKEGLFQ